MARDRTKLSDPEVQAWLAKHPGWALEQGMIRRTFTFADFRRAMGFVNRIADAAEAADHHPDIDIRYRRVRVRWSTHSAGGVTDKDRELAARTDELA